MINLFLICYLMVIFDMKIFLYRDLYSFVLLILVFLSRVEMMYEV